MLGRRVGHDARRRDERHRLRHPRARQHRRRDRRLRVLADPGVRRPGRQQLLRTGPPRRRCAPPGSGACAGCSTRPSRAATTSSPSCASFAAAAHSDEALDDLEGLLDGSLVLDGLAIDADLRWTLVGGLARAGRADEDRIADELRRDNTISGRERAAAARAARPTAEAKAEAWDIAVVRDDVPNETQRSVVLAFMQHGQDELLEPYVEKYLATAETMWEEKGTQRASTALEFLFPRPLASRELLDRVTSWLQESDANPAAKRYVREGAADVERYLAGQAKDARAEDVQSTPACGPDSRSYSCRVGRLPGGLGELADAVLDAADEVARGEGRLHARHGETHGVVAQRAAYDRARDHLEQAGPPGPPGSARCARVTPVRRGAAGRRGATRPWSARRRRRTRTGKPSRPRGSHGRSRPPGSWRSHQRPLVPPASFELCSIWSGVTSSTALTPLVGPPNHSVSPRHACPGW